MQLKNVSALSNELICTFEGWKETMQLRLRGRGNASVRVTRTLRGEFLNQESHVVVGGEDCAYTLTEDERALYMALPGLTVAIDRRSGRLTFLDAQNRVLLEEGAHEPCVLLEKELWRYRFDDNVQLVERKSVDGVRVSAAGGEAYLDRMAYECKHNLVFDADEALYGLGSHEEGYGNLRGRCRALYQHNLKAVVPMLVSTKGWGLLYDLGCTMMFHDDADGSYLWAEYADEMDFYFMGGGSYDAVMTAYRALTGAAPLLPRYAFGYTQSKERYVDAAEMIAVVEEYRRREVPLDVIVLDWCSWPDGQWGYKIFDRTRFEDPDAFIQKIHDLNAKLMISIWPSMNGNANANREEMLREKCMLGNRTIYDAFNEKGRRIYWRQAQEGLFCHGVDAWWCDCSEPFESDWRGRIRPESFERIRVNGEEAKRYCDAAKVAEYSLLHSGGIYEGQRGCSDKRVYNLTRSSYAGQHRYATVTWSGDVSANWETLRRHIPEGLNFSVTGEAYWSADIGAFFCKRGGQWFRDGDYPEGVEDLGYRELYVRWLQYATFLPVMRSHGTDTPREIWRFGEKGTMFYDAIEKAIGLRYVLLPYMYSLAAEYTRSGMPMMRVPALEFPQDKALRGDTSMMMLGDALLIRPVTRPMYYQPESVPMQPADCTETVYLPQGAGWYLLDTEEFFPGGQSVTLDAPIDRIPAFVRAGAILPCGPVVQHSGVRPEKLQITVYPGADGAFVLYDDAGDGYGYEKGECARIALAWDDAARTLSVAAREGGYPGMPEQLNLEVRCAGGQAVKVAYQGQAVRVQL